MLTIKEIADKTGLSTYELRRRVHAGQCPYTRVGAKGTKILIDYAQFNTLLSEENQRNMAAATYIKDVEDTTGYNKIRQIN